MAAGADGLEPLADPEVDGAGVVDLSPERLSPEPLSPEPLSAGFLSEPELDSDPAEVEDPDEEPADSLGRGRLSVL